MSLFSNPDQATDPVFRWWWILPGLAALLGGLSYWLWMRRHQMKIQPVRLDLSFVRSQTFQPESAPLPASAEILIPISDEPAGLQPLDGTGLSSSNGFDAVI
jgi:hypothetical protein